MEVHAAAALIAVASFASGALQPLLFAWLVNVICRSRGRSKPNMLAFVVAMVFSLGTCSSALVFLAALDRAPAFAIAIAFVLGVGAARLFRREI